MSDWLNHTSQLGRMLGKVQEGTDILNLVGGHKWSSLVNEKLPDFVNSAGSHVMQPFEYVDKTVNPVRKIPIVDRIGNIVAAKPGDAGALAAGAYFGGSALMGSGGFGGGGAAGGAADGGSMNLFADAIPGAGGDVGASSLPGALGTSSGFGGVGMDPAATGLDGSSIDPALAGDNIDAGGGWNPSSGGSSGINYQQLLGKALNQMGQQKQQQAQGGGRGYPVNTQPGNVPYNFMGGM